MGCDEGERVRRTTEEKARRTDESRDVTHHDIRELNDGDSGLKISPRQAVGNETGWTERVLISREDSTGRAGADVKQDPVDVNSPWTISLSTSKQTLRRRREQVIQKCQFVLDLHSLQTLWM